MSVLLRTIRTYSLRSGEADDGVQGCAQLVGHRSHEGTLHAQALLCQKGLLGQPTAGLGDAGDVGGDALVTDDLPSVVEDGVEADVEHLSRLSL